MATVQEVPGRMKVTQDPAKHAPLAELDGSTAAELEEKLAAWSRRRKQRLGLENAEEELEEYFKGLGLPEPDADEDAYEHVFGRQALRISSGSNSYLQTDELIQALLDKFGEEAEEFLARTEDGEVDKESFAPRFHKDSDWVSYTPKGEVDE